MTPVHCAVKHDPKSGKFGDCLRACVASVLDLPIDAVPHFYHDGCTGEVANERLRAWLFHYDRNRPFFSSYSGEASFDDVMGMMGFLNPNVTYILFGSSEGGGDHAVVCHGGEMVHNPAWVPGKLVGPLSVGIWTALVISAT